MRFLITAAMLGAICSGCHKAKSCENFPHKYSLSRVNFFSFPPVKKNSVKEVSLKTIDKCYPNFPYLGSVRDIKFEEARKNDNNTYLIYDPVGVEDVKIIFVVDESGDIIDSYQYSTL